MNETIGSELEELGRVAAEQVAGNGSVERVEVERGEDVAERPAYHFSFLIDQHRAQERAGLIRIRLIQRLQDDLLARGDPHLAVIQIFNKEDWVKRTNAKPV